MHSRREDNLEARYIIIFFVKLVKMLQKRLNDPGCIAVNLYYFHWHKMFMDGIEQVTDDERGKQCGHERQTIRDGRENLQFSG